MIKLREKGFTLVEIMIVVAIIAILSAIAIPNFMAARSKSRANACKANLKQFESAVEQYAMDNNLVDGDTVELTSLIPTFIKKTPTCQSNGTYGAYNGNVADTPSEVDPVGGVPTDSYGIFVVGGTPGCNIGARKAAGGYPHVLY